MTPRLILAALFGAIERWPLLWLSACALVGWLAGAL